MNKQGSKSVNKRASDGHDPGASSSAKRPRFDPSDDDLDDFIGRVQELTMFFEAVDSQTYQFRADFVPQLGCSLDAARQFYRKCLPDEGLPKLLDIIVNTFEKVKCDVKRLLRRVDELNGVTVSSSPDCNAKPIAKRALLDRETQVCTSELVPTASVSAQTDAVNLVAAKGAPVGALNVSTVPSTTLFLLSLNLVQSCFPSLSG